MGSSKEARPATAAAEREPQSGPLGGRINFTHSTRDVTAATAAVYDGRNCIGFVARGKAVSGDTA